MKHERPTSSVERGIIRVLKSEVELAQPIIDWMEGAAIARNPNTPLDVVKRLAEDRNVVAGTIARQKVTQIGTP